MTRKIVVVVRVGTQKSYIFCVAVNGNLMFLII